MTEIVGDIRTGMLGHCVFVKDDPATEPECFRGERAVVLGVSYGEISNKLAYTIAIGEGRIVEIYCGGLRYVHNNHEAWIKTSIEDGFGVMRGTLQSMLLGADVMLRDEPWMPTEFKAKRGIVVGVSYGAPSRRLCYTVVCGAYIHEFMSDALRVMELSNGMHIPDLCREAPKE